MKAKSGAALLFFWGALSLGCAGLLGLDDRKFEGEGGGGAGGTTGGTGGGGEGGTAGGTGGGGEGGTTGGTGGACDDGASTPLVDDTFDFDACSEPVAALTNRGWTYTRAAPAMGGEEYPMSTPYPAVKVDGARFVLELATTLYWSFGKKGALLYKEIDGDFLVVTTLSIENKKDGGLPTDDQTGAGIMVRHPDGSKSIENDQTWIAFHLGTDSMEHPGLGTIHASWSEPGSMGSADVSVTNVGSLGPGSKPEGRIALCRKDGQFSLWLEEGPNNWVEKTAHMPPGAPEADLGASVQVGLFAYSYNNDLGPSPDGVVAAFEQVQQLDPAVKGCDPKAHLAD